jgi:hypothetical protein
MILNGIGGLVGKKMKGKIMMSRKKMKKIITWLIKKNRMMLLLLLLVWGLRIYLLKKTIMLMILNRIRIVKNNKLIIMMVFS